MKLNRKISLILSLTLVISNAPMAFAEENFSPNNIRPINSISAINTTEIQYISKDKAISIAKQALKDYCNLSIDEKQFTLATSQYIPDKNNVLFSLSLWNVLWTSKNSEETISVSIDASTGDINSFYIPYDNKNKNVNSSMTMTEGEKLANDFLSKVYPNKYNEFRIANCNEGNGMINISFSRYFNGIEFPMDTIFIDIDAVNKKPVQFNYNYTSNIEFAKQESTLITKETGKKIFSDNIKMNLIYIENNKVSNEYIPVYSPSFTKGYTLNANKSEFFNNPTTTVNYKISNEDLDKIIKKYSTKVDAKKLLSTDDAKLLSIKYCKDILGKDLAVIKISKDKFSSESPSNNTNTWNIELSDKNNKEIYVTLNADNSSILNIYDNYESNTSEKFTPSITWKEAYIKALETIAKYAPGKITHINTSHYINELPRKDLDGNYMESNYYFNFTRNENGIDLPSDCIYVSINAKTGGITSFGCNWNNNASFVNSKNIISEESAKKIFMDSNNVKLKYILEDSTQRANLSYILDFNGHSSQLINATNSKFVEY